MRAPSSHPIGVTMVVISAIVFSLAGVFTKSISAGSWEIIFWRSFFSVIFIIAYVCLQGKLRIETLNMGRSGLAAAIISASGTAAFIPAFKYTTMANVILIYAAAPLIAALMAWIYVGERMTRKIMIGCGASIIGVLIIILGSNNGFGSGNTIKGDLLALWMTISMAVFMVIYRKYPDTPAAGPTIFSNIILVSCAALFAAPFMVSSHDLWLCVIFGLTFSVAAITLAEGVKRISAGETAILSLLETPLAPLFGWMFFAEIPAGSTFIGGGLVLAAVLATQI